MWYSLFEIRHIIQIKGNLCYNVPIDDTDLQVVPDHGISSSADFRAPQPPVIRMVSVMKNIGKCLDLIIRINNKLL